MSIELYTSVIDPEMLSRYQQIEKDIEQLRKGSYKDYIKSVTSKRSKKNKNNRRKKK